jgi:hypothetical protein
MTPRFPRRGADQGAPQSGSTVPQEPGLRTSPTRREDRACCCPAHPVVRAIMPPAPGRPHSVDLLLCGHHYRVSRRALAAAGAEIFNLPGKADAAAAALLDNAHGHRVGVLSARLPAPVLALKIGDLPFARGPVTVVHRRHHDLISLPGSFHFAIRDLARDLPLCAGRRVRRDRAAPAREGQAQQARTSP